MPAKVQRSSTSVWFMLADSASASARWPPNAKPKQRMRNALLYNIGSSSLNASASCS